MKMIDEHVATLDLREITAEQAVDMLIAISGLRTRAGSLHTGDKVVYYDDRSGVYCIDTILSSTGSYWPGQRPSAHDWRITTASGDSWSCSPENTRCLVVAR